jgi:hypothetical protein
MNHAQEILRILGMDENKTITTEDGVALKEGDRAYNYYDMKPGMIEAIHEDGWFRFVQAGGNAFLNGQRVCSMEFAIRRGFKGAEDAA